MLCLPEIVFLLWLLLTENGDMSVALCVAPFDSPSLDRALANVTVLDPTTVLIAASAAHSGDHCLCLSVTLS